MPAFEARGGAAEQHGRLLAVAAQDGHVARMVARCLVLLVGILVLLVHDDDAQVFERRKNRAARADDDPRGPAVDLVPLVVALAVGKVAVQDGDLFLHVREPGFEPLDRLRGQRDFGDEHQRGAPVIDRLADRAQVDFGLPRTRDAEKQDRLRGGVRHRLLDRLQRNLLLGIQNQVRRGKEFFRVGIAGEDRRFDDDQPALFQHAKNSLRHARQFRRRRNRDRRARFDHRTQGVRLPGGALFERGQLLPRDLSRRTDRVPPLFRNPPVPHRHRQHAAHRGLDRAAVIVGHPAGQFEECRPDHRLLVEQLRDVAHPADIRKFQHLDHRGCEQPRPHRNLHARSHRDRVPETFRHTVIQQPPRSLVR